MSFVKLFHENKTEAFLNFLFLDRSITSMVKEVDTQVGRTRQHELRSLAVQPSSAQGSPRVACLPGPWPPFLQRLCALAARRCSSRTCALTVSSVAGATWRVSLGGGVAVAPLAGTFAWRATGGSGPTTTAATTAGAARLPPGCAFVLALLASRGALCPVWTQGTFS